MKNVAVCYHYKLRHSTVEEQERISGVKARELEKTLNDRGYIVYGSDRQFSGVHENFLVGVSLKSDFDEVNHKLQREILHIIQTSNLPYEYQTYFIRT